MIRSALFGLVFWAMLAFAGWGFLGPIEGISFWRVFFMAGYSGYVMGLCSLIARIRLEQDCLTSFEEHHVAETADLNDEIERLQALLNRCDGAFCNNGIPTEEEWGRDVDELLVEIRAALDSPPSAEEEE